MKKQFILRKKLVHKGVQLLSPLFALAPLYTVSAAEGSNAISTHAFDFINVTGKVVDASGEPVAGATVSIKGTTAGTQTDAEGTFHLNLPKGDETLVVSFIGYTTQEYPVNGQTSLTITLAQAADALDEVVVVGYGTQKKAHLTGAVETVDMDAIQDVPATNIGSALAGRIAGINVTGGIGRPGEKSTIEVRRTVPFGKDAGTTEPLYVIDGMIQVDEQNQPESTLFNNLDPSEIQSISILKDGAAAVYGVRGANGVVLVTTNRGKAGKPKISYNGSYGINDAARHTDMMNAYEFAQYFNIMNGKNGANQVNNLNNYFFSEDEMEYFKNHNYNWLDDAWKSSYNTRHALSVSGGAERATYFGSVTYSKQNGNLGTLDYNKWNFRAGTDVQVSSDFKIGLQVSGNDDKLDKTFNKVSGENPEDDYRNLLTAVPYVPAYLNGMPVKRPGTGNDKSTYHFYEIQRLGNLAETASRFFSINISAEYKAPFLEGLTAKATYSRNMRHSVGSQIGTKYDLYQFRGSGQYGHIYDGNAFLDPDNPMITASNGNRLFYSNRSGNNTQMNFFLTYDKQIGNHNFSGLFSVERGEAEGEQEDVWKDSPLETTNGQFGTAFGAIDGRTFANESGSLGYIGRVNYRYGEKYLVEFLFRTDASTKFAPENYWGKFWSASAGWVVSEEDFFKSDVVNFLKLRYSIGKMGNDQFRAWAWRQRYTYEVGKGPVFGGNENSGTGMRMDRSPNRDATWSDELKNNLGIETRFLNNRLSATVDGYFNKATNILLERLGTMPVTVGGSIAPENYAAVNTYGYDISLGWSDHVGKDFSYGVSARYSWSDGKIKNMDRSAADIATPWITSNGSSLDVGKWGWDYLGMFKSQADIDAYVNEYNITSVFGTPADQLKPGMLYYRDVRGPLQADGTFAPADGIIDDNDWVKLADKENSWHNFGLTLRAGYKNISFETVISGSFGGWAEIGQGERKKLNNDLTRVFDNRPNIWNDIWDPELNPNGTMPNPNWEDMYNKSSNFWRVSSFRMRVTSLNVGYTLPKPWLENINVSNARLYFSAMNPLGLYSAYSYRDTYAGAWDTYPNLKTFSFGLNVTL